MLNLIWRDTAMKDLEAITSYIIERNPTTGFMMEDLFIESAQKLTESPYIGRIGRVSGTREFVVHPNYILVYKILIGELHIIRLLHSRQRYP